jgi:hypothetical protein
MRVFRRFAILWMALAVLAVGLTLSSCDCPSYFAGVARVRLLNWVQPDARLVGFDFYPHGAPLNPDDAMASGSFGTTDEVPEAYAMRDGGIYVFQTDSGGAGYDVHVFVDVTNDFEYSAGDEELLVTNVIVVGDSVVEVDYQDFTTVD